MPPYFPLFQLFDARAEALASILAIRLSFDGDVVTATTLAGSRSGSADQSARPLTLRLETERRAS